MGMLDAFIGKDVILKTESAIRQGEASRRASIRAVLAKHGIQNMMLEAEILTASAQSPILRRAAGYGGPYLGEILTRIADKLDGK